MKISIHNLSKTYFSLKRGRIPALHQVNLEIESGSFFVLLGPSGCGKSTLLNILSGIERPSEGEITMGDKTVCSVDRNIWQTPKERNIAMVFQHYALYPHLTIFDNIAFPLKIQKVKSGLIEQKVLEVAQILKIEDLLKATPAEISGGQQQRVALGRALVRKPNLLLLDEPLSNLDALLRIHMQRELKELQKSLGLTIVYVTHDQKEAMSLGDQVAIFKEGRVQQTADPLTLYNSPNNIFVAQFIGTPPMNIIKGAGTENHIGIRPEHIQLVPVENAKRKGQIAMINHFGHDQLIYVDMGEGLINIKTTQDHKVKEGDWVGLKFQKDRICRFNRDGGERITGFDQPKYEKSYPKTKSD